jgi:GABA(A) receptor-associated protein
MNDEAQRIMDKYPSRVPIIVTKHKHCKLPDIDKNKYLVDKDMNIREFLYVIRSRIKLDKSETIFLTINNKLSSSNDIFSKIYNNEKNKDGFLYVVYSSENTFG